MMQSLNIIVGYKFYRKLLIIFTLSVLLSMFVSLLYLARSRNMSDNQFKRGIHSEDSPSVYSFKQVNRSKSLSKELHIFSLTILPNQTVTNSYSHEYKSITHGSESSHAKGVSLHEFQTVTPKQSQASLNLSQCSLPTSVFKGWRYGVVTKMRPNFDVYCDLLFRGNRFEVELVQNVSSHWPIEEQTSNFMKWAEQENCTRYQEEFQHNLYTTKEEANFPLAFALVVHESPLQVFRLLKVIYRPHNVYCIHYDNKSSLDTKLVFNNLAMCIDNIFVATSIIEVKWGHRSLMEAQMNCFKDLKKNYDAYPWKYVITLCGKELPLRTNREMVQLLKNLNGTSAINTHLPSKSEQDRYTRKWAEIDNQYYITQESAGPIPYNLTMYKSMVYFALTPEFVEYVLYNKVANALRKFLKDAFIPEEHYYSTLFMIPGKFVKG